MKERGKRVFVSSTVYGIEELLERIYSRLTALGYEVMMSYKGTVPVSSQKTTFENCIEAVRACDLFLGIITPSYGSGVDPDDASGLSITHQEFREAMRLSKPRWALVHDHVVFMRDYLNKLGFRHVDGRGRLRTTVRTLVSVEDAKMARRTFDLRSIDQYEEVIQDHAGKDRVPLSERKGNWVQPFALAADGELFAYSQFSRYQEAEAFVGENFGKKNGGRK